MSWALGAAALVSTSVTAAPAVAEPGLVTLSTPDDVSVNGTLRHEVANAAAGETVSFAPGAYATLSNQISINQGITIAGQGMAISYVYGGSNSRIFNVAAGPATVRLQNLTLLDGNAPDNGPGVKGASGGAVIFSQGRLEVDHVRFQGNEAGDSAYAGDASDGGTIGANGTDGAAGGDGGAIAANGSGQLVVTRSAFDGNVAGQGGTGGFGGDGITQNGDGGDGGGGGLGGAIFSDSSSPALISDSTFTANHGGVAGAGGSAGTGTGIAGSGGTAGLGGSGGAVAGAVSEISGSTFTGNIGGYAWNGGSGTPAGLSGTGGSGGAIFAPSPTITNSTIGPGNAGGVGGSGGAGPGHAGNGGGVQLTVGGTVASSTIVGNEAYLGPTGVATAGVGGGLVGTAASTIRNSIVANNKSANLTTAASANCLGPLIDGGRNLTFPAATGCPGTVADPLLNPLAANGGPTQTMSLKSGSPALDQGSGCPSTDQRGIARPQGPACDIGAFEVEVPVVPGGTDPPAKKKCKKKKKRKHRGAAAKKCKKKKKKKKKKKRK